LSRVRCPLLRRHPRVVTRLYSRADIILVQGAFRLRGIGRGQRIEVLITPEVERLIEDAAVKSFDGRRLKKHLGGRLVPNATASSPRPSELCAVVQWLHVNTMRSESLQFHLLCDQSLSNVWRKAAFRRLRAAHEARRTASTDAARVVGSSKRGASTTDGWSKDLSNAIDLFRTKVALGISYEVPKQAEPTSSIAAADQSALPPATRLPAPAGSTHRVSGLGVDDSLATAVPMAEAPIHTDGGPVRNDGGRVYTVMERDGGAEIAASFLLEPSQVEVCNRITSRLNRAEAVELEHTNRQTSAKLNLDGTSQTSKISAFDAMGAEAEEEEQLEQQQESQQEEEREQQQQTVIVRSELDEPASVVLDDVAAYDFSREIPAPHLWRIDALGRTPELDASDFYPLSNLKLRDNSFAPLRFPSSLLLSLNYFRPTWFKTAHRRLKNVIMLLDWAPGVASTGVAVHVGNTSAAEERLRAAWGTQSGAEEGAAACATGGSADRKLASDAVERLLVEGGVPFEQAAVAREQHEQGELDLNMACRLLASSQPPMPQHASRYVIAVSLEEAEALRALLHGLQARGQPLLGGGATLALRHAEQLFETSPGCPLAADEDELARTARQCFRLFDSEVNFSPSEVRVVLRAIQSNPPESRVHWFEAVRACRRRERRDWRSAPIARIFTTEDDSQLQQEDEAQRRVSEMLQRNRLHAATFFVGCDADHDGIISERDLKNGLNSLDGPPIDPTQFAVLVRRLDSDRDGAISRQEWCSMFEEAAADQLALVRDEDLEPYDGEEEDGEDDGSVHNASRRLPGSSSVVDAPSSHGAHVASKRLELDRLLKLTVRLHPLAKALREAWSTRGLPTEQMFSLWAPEVKAEFWPIGRVRHRFCVGHYGNSSLDRPKIASGLSVPEVEDVLQWQVIKDGALDQALSQYAPHPDYFKIEYFKDSVEPNIYAWRPVPPSEDFVSLGMIFTKSNDEPPTSSMRCIHRSWLRPTSVEPELLWKDTGLGGQAGSFWKVNSMQLVVATKGHARPEGPFYELIDTPFTLAEVAAGKSATARRNLFPGGVTVAEPARGADTDSHATTDVAAGALSRTGPGIEACLQPPCCADPTVADLGGATPMVTLAHLAFHDEVAIASIPSSPRQHCADQPSGREQQLGVEKRG